MDALFSAPIGALIIFCLRIVDVSMSMMRMILAVRGHRILAACIGFFEVLVWLFAAGNALEHLDSVIHLVGYAAGFATGNYVGVSLEARFALGINVVRAVVSGRQTTDEEHDVATYLREQGLAVTQIDGRGQNGRVAILNIVVQRRKVPRVIRLLHEVDPTSFVTVEEIRSTRNGYLDNVSLGEQRGFPRPGGRKFPYLLGS